MVNTIEIKNISKNIEVIRKSKDMWREFEYAQPDNYVKRHALAIALQYDWRLEDKELIKFLIINEVEDRKNDSFQGCGDSLTLISYLLAKYKEPENIWLFEEAKCANFDTFCGYYSEFIFSAGIEATCKYLEKFELTENNKYLFKLKNELQSIFTEKDIEEFLERMESWFPDRIEKESTETLLERAIEFNDYNEGERLLGVLEKEDNCDYGSLYYRAKSLENYPKAILYQERILETAKNAQEKVSSLHNISEMYCLNLDFLNAFETSKKWYSLLDLFDDWRQIGLGRFCAENWFDICLGLYNQNSKYALDSFKYGDAMVRKLKNYSLQLLEKAYKCSEYIGSSRDKRYYWKMVEKEKKRIAEMLK